MKKNLMILLASCVVFSPLMALNTSNLSSDESVLARGGGGGGGGGEVVVAEELALVGGVLV